MCSMLSVQSLGLTAMNSNELLDSNQPNMLTAIPKIFLSEVIYEKHSQVILENQT
jgi:hypothetical protein